MVDMYNTLDDQAGLEYNRNLLSTELCRPSDGVDVCNALSGVQTLGQSTD